jgi:hypothetical protein
MHARQESPESPGNQTRVQQRTIFAFAAFIAGGALGSAVCTAVELYRGPIGQLPFVAEAYVVEIVADLILRALPTLLLLWASILILLRNSRRYFVVSITTIFFASAAIRILARSANTGLASLLAPNCPVYESCLFSPLVVAMSLVVNLLFVGGFLFATTRCLESVGSMPTPGRSR